MTDTTRCGTDTTPVGTSPATLRTNAVGLHAELLRLGTMDARARVCFRMMAVCLSAFVLIVITLALHLSTQTFFEVIRQTATVNESLRAMPIETALASSERPTSMPDIANWPNAAVAVVTALLVGNVVLAIALIRATFSLTVDTEKATTAGRSGREGFGLPGVELLKATKEAIATVTKGVSPR